MIKPFPQTQKRRSPWFPAAALAVCLGCGAADIATLDCRVTRDGQPRPGAEIHFERTGENPATFFAVSMDGGNCYIDLGDRPGLPAGDYTISVAQYEQKDGTPLPGGEEGEALKSAGKAVRKQYVFQRKLAPGANSLELKLEEGQEAVEAETANPAPFDPALTP
jgi:hypothetical protein